MTVQQTAIQKTQPLQTSFQNDLSASAAPPFFYAAHLLRNIRAALFFLYLCIDGNKIFVTVHTCVPSYKYSYFPCFPYFAAYAIMAATVLASVILPV